MLCPESFSFTLFSEPFSLGTSVRNMNTTPLLPAELQEELEGLGTLQKGAQLFPHDPLRDSFLLALLPSFSAPRLILETHP